MYPELTDKVVLVTGAAAGIGLETAKLFAANGARLVIADLDPELAHRAAADIQEAGGAAIFVEVDVSQAVDVELMVAVAVEHYGRLDCAINNAGVDHKPQRLEDCTEADWDRTIAINLKGVFLCLRQELPEMTRQGGGVIVNTASIAGLGGAPKLAPYAASKHGVVGLTRTAAVEYATRGIRVNAVCPSYTRTQMVARVLEAQPDLADKFANASPMKRLGEPQEVARTIVWLCSDAASFINGQAVAIDGGITAW